MARVRQEPVITYEPSGDYQCPDFDGIKGDSFGTLKISRTVNKETKEKVEKTTGFPMFSTFENAVNAFGPDKILGLVNDALRERAVEFATEQMAIEFMTEEEKTAKIEKAASTLASVLGISVDEAIRRIKG